MRILVFGFSLLIVLLLSSCVSMKSGISQELPRQILHLKNGTISYIATEKSGRKPYLILVHGAPGDARALERYMHNADLKQKYNIISIDRLGYKQTNLGKNPNSLEAQTEIIFQLIDALEIGAPISLLGHSYGGPVILKAAAMQPKAFHTLFILGGSIDPKREPFRIIHGPIHHTPLKYLLPASWRRANSEVYFLKDELPLLLSDLDKVTSQTVVIHGKKDQLVYFRNAELLSKCLDPTRTKRIDLEKDGHFIPWTRFDVIKQALLDF